jgi:hypothetical protein
MIEVFLLLSSNPLQDIDQILTEWQGSVENLILWFGTARQPTSHQLVEIALNG